MKLLSYLELKEKDIISIVGAGGKTSLMFQLAQEIKKNDSKLLLTTTTKIYVPQKEKYDFICIGENQFSKYAKLGKKGIYVYGTEINVEDKVIGLQEEQLDDLVKYFDYTLIEADGSKMKPIKGWNDNEPVVFEKTTKTIGVLDIQVLGMKICEGNVHRIEKFCEITNSDEGKIITHDHLLNVILHPKGIFKNAKGEKILFINKVDRPYNVDKAKELVNKINTCDLKTLDKIIIGSIKNNLYYSCR